ncbi:MAG TPA: TonB-dependent receptor [Rhizomicrobium sp.]|nr:TonB-dependent receptor [Rhizomicrobium sp.]
MTNLFRARWLAGTALPLVLLMTGAEAQSQSQSQTSANGVTINGFETVMVDARKRTENAQAVPISISTYGQAELDRLNIKSIEGIRYSSPSLYIAPTSFRQDTLNITIRGQRNFDAPSGGGNSGLAFDTATAVYKDGVYYARAVGLGGALFDLENVSVLKGPQGTLVGRNSTGGALLYRSREPGDAFEAFVKGTLGDYGRAGIQGILNVPLSDTVSVRAAVNLDNQKGYITNLFFDPVSGMRNNQAAMGSNKLAGLFSLKWQPDETTKLVLRADIAAQHDTGVTYHSLDYFVGTVPSLGRTSICNIPGTCPSTTLVQTPPISFVDLLGHTVGPYYLSASPTGVGARNTATNSYNALLNSLARQQARGFWTAEQALSNLNVGHYQTYSATLDKNFDGIDLKLMAAYRTWDNVGQAVSRGQPFVMNTFEFNFPNYESFQSELTLNGSLFSDALKWTTGLFYFNETSPNDGGLLYLFLPNAGRAPQAVQGRQLTITDSRNNDMENSSYAAYAQLTYNLMPGTRITAGGRYTYDERFAHQETRTIRTPSTQTLAGIQGGTWDPSAVTYQGISYIGATVSCFMTSATGAILPLSQCNLDTSKSYHKPTWTLSLDHDLWDGTMLYGAMRSGYRSGGINPQSINTAAQVALPEDVLDYELGIKSDFVLWDMPVRVNLAGYETVYHNIQVQQSVPNVTLATAVGGGPCTQAAFNAGNCLSTFNDNITLNARAAKIYGVEWDFSILPNSWLTLRTNGSYIDPRYTDYSFLVPPGYLQPSGNTNLSGTPIPVPAWQTSQFVAIDLGRNPSGLPLGNVRLNFHYYWQSRFLADMRNYHSSMRTSPYGMLNFRLAFEDFLQPNTNLAFFVNNVTNTKACLPEFTGVLNSAPNGTFGVPNTSGLLQCIPLAPRMTGLQLSYRY